MGYDTRVQRGPQRPRDTPIALPTPLCRDNGRGECNKSSGGRVRPQNGAHPMSGNRYKASCMTSYGGNAIISRSGPHSYACCRSLSWSSGLRKQRHCTCHLP